MKVKLALIAVLLVALYIWFAFDIRVNVESFEDGSGSGRIVWCVPGELCDD
jgi:hypothetical protein